VTGQVHTRGIESQSHVKTVINQQGHAVRGQGGLETYPQGIEVTGAEVFFTQLDSPGAPPGCGGHNLRKVTPGSLVAVSDDIEVKIDTAWLS
jgi:hypothetical protein